MNNSDEIIVPLLKKKFNLISSNINISELCKLLSSIISQIDKEGTKIVSIVGGAASGKTTLTQTLCNTIENSAFISTDDYLIGDRQFRRENIEGNDPLLKYDFNFLNQKIAKICSGIPTKTPVYNQKSGIAIAAGEENFPKSIEGNRKVLFVEGDFHPVKNPDLVIYLHTSDEIRLSIRILRDKQERNATEEEIRESFNQRQELQHFPHTLPQAKKANILICSNVNNGKFSYDVYGRR